MSNLLSQASLVMIPSGYKEDVVYSQIPTSGAGDLSITRASNGTRINSAGLVEVCPWNLLQYSEDFSNAAWTQSAVTITANSTTAPNGTTTADTIAFSSGGYVGVTRTDNGSMTFSVYAKYIGTQWLCVENFNQSDKAGWFDLLNGVIGGTANGATNSIENLGNSWYRCSVTMTATDVASSTYAIFSVSANNGFTRSGSAYFYGAQLNIGSTAKPYFPTTDRLNVPRLTYQNGGGGCPSLLLEKQSTNVLLRSEEFDSASWTKNGATITANTVTSPDGTQNADTLTGASGNYRIYQIVSGLSSVDYTFSVFAKKGTANLIWFDFINVGDGPSFNFTTKAWSSASGWTTSYEEHANGWFRLIATKASNTTSAGLGIKVGAVNETVYLWGAQMEASSYKTTYIPTTSSSATRVADACFKTGISSLIGQTEGVLFVDINPEEFQTGSYIGITDGTITNRIIFGFESGSVNSGTLQVYGISGVNGSGTYTRGQRMKIALAYKSGNSALYVNGSLISTATTTFTASFSQFRFDSYGGTQNFIGKVTEAIIFPTRLTNAELAQLTA